MSTSITVAADLDTTSSYLDLHSARSPPSGKLCQSSVNAPSTVISPPGPACHAVPPPAEVQVPSQCPIQRDQRYLRSVELSIEFQAKSLERMARLTTEGLVVSIPASWENEQSE